MPHLRRLPALALTCAAASCAAAAILPGLASADQTLPGAPLGVTVGDLGQLQGRLAGATDGIFYSPTAPVGDAGFFLAFPATTAPAQAQAPALSGRSYGFQGGAGPSTSFDDTTGLQSYVARGQDAPTGSGTAADPHVQVTRYAVPDATTPDDSTTDAVSITQTTTYVEGTQTFDVKWEVKNQTGQSLPFKAIAAADFYFEGSDVGTGIFTQGPPRFIGGTNADTGRSGGFLESPAPATPWSHYQALQFGSDDTEVWGRVQSSASSTGNSFDDSVLGDPADNAGATEWDQNIDAPLADGQTATFSTTVRTALPAALGFDKTNAGAPQGVPIAFLVTARDTAGTAFAGKVLRYTIGGANPLTSAVAIGADGNAVIVDPGTNAGPDTIIAFLDLNNDGVRQASEPQGSTLATFVDNVPAKCTVSVKGDRAVSVGGSGKPLVITVDCDSAATVTTATTLKIRRPARRVKGKKVKAKTYTVKLATSTTPVAPGQALPLDARVSKTTQKKYPGLKGTATVTVTAVDAAGNTSTFKDTQAVKILRVAKKKK